MSLTKEIINLQYHSLGIWVYGIASTTITLCRTLSALNISYAATDCRCATYSPLPANNISFIQFHSL